MGGGVLAAEGGGEGVEVGEGVGEGGGDDVEGVEGGCCCCWGVRAEVAEGEVEVGISVEVGEREGVVLEKRRVGREDQSAFWGFDPLHA